MLFLSPAFPPRGGKKKQSNRSKAKSRAEEAWFIGRLVTHLRIIKSWLEAAPNCKYHRVWRGPSKRHSKEKELYSGRLLLGREMWLLVLISPLRLVSSLTFSWLFFPFLKNEPLPAFFLWMDVNMILGEQFLEPLEIREVEIITKMEMTDCRNPKATAKSFLCYWMIYWPKALPGPALDLWSSHPVLPPTLLGSRLRIHTPVIVSLIRTSASSHQEALIRLTAIMSQVVLRNGMNLEKKKIVDWEGSGFWGSWKVLTIWFLKFFSGKVSELCGDYSGIFSTMTLKGRLYLHSAGTFSAKSPLPSTVGNETINKV